jgi:hypothetical protein
MVDLGGATTGWCPERERERERERGSLLIYKRKGEGLCDDIF